MTGNSLIPGMTEKTKSQRKREAKKKRDKLAKENADNISRMHEHAALVEKAAVVEQLRKLNLNSSSSMEIKFRTRVEYHSPEEVDTEESDDNLTSYAFIFL